jgi:hypothetical protein
MCGILNCEEKTAMTVPGELHVSRRRFMTTSAAGAGAAAVAGSFSAAEAEGTAARHAASFGLTDAVLRAFKSHRLVGIGEVHHSQDHLDALGLLLNDPRLPGVVNDIVVEFGNALYQPVMDRFINGELISDSDLRLAWRNTTQSPAETWDEPAYEQFFRTVRAVNWARPPGKRIRVLLGDPPIDWANITSLGQIVRYLAQRDSHPASVIEKEVLGKGRRALICYGMAHVFHPTAAAVKAGGRNIAWYLKHHTGQAIYTIADLVPLDGDPGGLAAKLVSYPRNAVIPAAGTWLGAFNAGLAAHLFLNRHNTVTNPFCGAPLRSLIDAGLYLAPPADLTASVPNPAIYLDPAYWAELQRRNKIQGNPVNLAAYRTQQPPRLPLQKEPTSAECGKAEE